MFFSAAASQWSSIATIATSEESFANYTPLMNRYTNVKGFSTHQEFFDKLLSVVPTDFSPRTRIDHAMMLIEAMAKIGTIVTMKTSCNSRGWEVCVLDYSESTSCKKPTAQEAITVACFAFANKVSWVGEKLRKSA